IPDASDKDAVNAIACAIDIQRKVIDLKSELAAEGLFPIDVGIGIASGIVLAGNIGTQGQMNYTVIGEPVNLAQRLESIAGEAEIIVAKSTYEQAQACPGAQIPFEPMPTVKVKGISRDVHPFRIRYTP
ncbi:MAG TPA: adenylate/guanylate cyclase domain-containing protein, partial [Deltaproteobacteria bacterium]|nr:adenylate/guanylate cyclase domain-containing protein [Deltaproteobacteria bacterium]